MSSMLSKVSQKERTKYRTISLIHETYIHSNVATKNQRQYNRRTMHTIKLLRSEGLKVRGVGSVREGVSYTDVDMMLALCLLGNHH